MGITRTVPALVAAVIASAATVAAMTVIGQAPARPIPAARPAPAPTVTRTITRTRVIRPVATITASAGAATNTLPAMPHVNGATHSMLVYCTREQCTTLPGAGPHGGTCGPVADGRQECVW